MHPGLTESLDRVRPTPAVAGRWYHRCGKGAISRPWGTHPRFRPANWGAVKRGERHPTDGAPAPTGSPNTGEWSGSDLRGTGHLVGGILNHSQGAHADECHPGTRGSAPPKAAAGQDLPEEVPTEGCTAGDQEPST